MGLFLCVLSRDSLLLKPRSLVLRSLKISALNARVLSLVTLFAACGGNDYPTGGGGNGGSGAGGAGGMVAGAYGAACAMDADCTGPGAICVLFDQTGMQCSVACTMASTCPAGSMGQKCNMKGQCRP